MKFEVESGGVRYEVEAPDQDAAIRALQKLKQDAPQMKGRSSDMGVAEDVARSAATGLGEGVTGLAGMGGDAAGMIGGLAGGVASVMGGDEQTNTAVADSVMRSLPIIGGMMPTADIEKATGFDQIKHEPQTTAGEYARTTGQFIPGAAVMGPGGIVKNALKFGVAPAVISETAGQATKGTDLEPFARTAGAVGAGMAAGLRRGKIPPAPSREALKAKSKTLYDAAKTEGLVLEQPAFAKAVDDITTAATNAGIDPAIHTKAYAALKRLNDAKGMAPTLDEVDTLRQIAGQAAKSNEPAERYMAGLIIDKLDDFMVNLKPRDVLSGGDPKKAIKYITEARKAWKIQRKAEVIEDIFQKVADTTSKYSASGRENAFRVAFRQLATNKNKMRMFTPEEQAAIRKVAQGGPIENTLRFFGKFAPTGVMSTAIGSGTGAVIGGALGVPGVGAVALPTLAAGARQGAKAMTENNAAFADALVRSGGKLNRLPSPAFSLLGLTPYYTEQTTR